MTPTSWCHSFSLRMYSQCYNLKCSKGQRMQVVMQKELLQAHDECAETSLFLCLSPHSSLECKEMFISCLKFFVHKWGPVRLPTFNSIVLVEV